MGKRIPVGGRGPRRGCAFQFGWVDGDESWDAPVGERWVDEGVSEELEVVVDEG